MVEFTVRAVEGIAEVRPGDDLAALIAHAAPWLLDDDVIVVTSKIVSKAEGRLVEVPPDGPARESARSAVLAAETARAVATRGQTRIVRTHHGFVLASAGIDASNVDKHHLVLLPVDPDASARRLREALRSRLGVTVAVIISDTMGRPWRLGLTDVAIGAAGIGALRDHRGQSDAHGNELSVTQVAVIDELAAAADLVKGKADQIPVAVIRGYRADTVGEGARALVRDADTDLFSLGTAEARAEGLRLAAALPAAETFAEASPAPGALDRARSMADWPIRRLGGEESGLGAALPRHTTDVLIPLVPPVTAASDSAADRDEAARHDARRLALAGAAVQRLRAALAAEGVASAWLYATDLDDPDARLGVIAVGAADPLPAGGP